MDDKESKLLKMVDAYEIRSKLTSDDVNKLMVKACKEDDFSLAFTCLSAMQYDRWAVEKLERMLSYE